MNGFVTFEAIKFTRQLRPKSHNLYN